MDRAALISCFEDTVRLSRKGKLARETERAIAASKVYFEGFTAPVSNERNENAFIEVETLTSFLAAKKYLQYGKVAVLNFANPENPGGGVKNGAMAQEECLCRSSNLFPCLEGKCIADDFYIYHKQQRDHSFSDRLIYTPGVTVFKTDETYPKLLPEYEWFAVDVITCAAPYQEKGRYVNPEYLLRLFTRRVKNILEAACDNRVDVLILGAFGCGAFRNPPQIVAQAFSQAIFEGNYQKKFKRIVFAIKPTREQCPNVSEFAGQFSCFSEDSQYEASILPIPPDYRFSKTPSLSYIAGRGYNPEFSNWQSKNKYYGKQFSIIGDSISTFEGYNPKGYKVFYDESTGLRAGVLSAEDTWWDKVISFFGGELLVNNAWSGSRVTMLPNKNFDELFPSACSPERTSNLHQGDVMPDVIVVNIGVNDWANGVGIWHDDLRSINEFYAAFDGAYSDMLQKTKKNYPDSEIWCCTLCETYIPNKPSFKFPHKYAGIHIEEYNKSIYKLAQENQCRVVDLYKYHIPYASMDGTHPTEEGMSTIANLIIREVCGTEVEAVVKAFPIKKPTREDPEHIDANSRFLLSKQIITEVLWPAVQRKIGAGNTESQKKNEETTALDDLVGKTIWNRYKVLKLLGQGGFFSTYLVMDEKLNKQWAMKVCNKNHKRYSRPIRGIFLQEPRMMMKLDHPAIPTIIDIFEDKNYICVVREYVEGETLDVVVRNQGPIKQEVVVDWAKQLCDALGYLHKQKPSYIYRDMKPANVILRPDGNVQIIDFGTALVYDPSKQDDTIIGTRGYAAPEQYAGKSDYRTDIFALGMTMHYLLTGVDPNTPPYETKPIREINPQLSDRLESIIACCIKPNADERFQTCDELMVALEGGPIPTQKKQGLL